MIRILCITDTAQFRGRFYVEGDILEIEDKDFKYANPNWFKRIDKEVKTNTIEKELEKEEKKAIKKEKE